ncbi:hypothetical protein A1353_05965 [Methylomonas methanica]|uniref:Uncharacterized protein n=1 Tax=Methylomonas methanica TaxID=421 RepID=A0A177MTM3_METMH|nr:hypothetical protein A1353_05965 [Methylomonas methanica]
MAAKFDDYPLRCLSCFRIRDSGKRVDLLGEGSEIVIDSKDTSQNAMQRYEIVLLVAMLD